MKKNLLLVVFTLFGACLTGLYAGAQTVSPPAITYSGPNTYAAGTAVTTLNPVNTGGMIPAGLYGQTSTIAANLSYITAIVSDTAHNIYVADNSYNVIKKITPAGVVSNFAGNGSAGFVNGTGSAASFSGINGLAIDVSGNIYAADGANNAIRKISPYGVVTTLAGNGTQGSGNGTGAAAHFYAPAGLALDNSGNVYVADFGNSLIRKITAAGVVTTFAGTGSAGYLDATGTNAIFNGPKGLAFDAAGTLYVADQQNELIRKITPAGVVSTLAGTQGLNGAVNGTGTAASFYYPQSVATDAAGNVYVADLYNYLIRKITPAGVLSTLAGTAGSSTAVDGAGTAAGFSSPMAIIADPSGVLYVADSYALRKVSITGYSAVTGLPAGLTFNPANGSISGTPLAAVAAANYNVTGYNAGGSSNAAVNIAVTGTLPATSPTVTAPAITYSSPQSYTTGTAVATLTPANSGGAVPGVYYGQTTTIASSIGDAMGLAIDASGNIYYADYSANVIRKITPAGSASIFAGTGSVGSADGTGPSASFNNPQRVAFDVAGNLYVADKDNNRIRKITPAGVVSTLAGSGVAGRNDGTGTSATFRSPSGIAVDKFGNVYVADAGNNLIRLISSAGVVSTLAGSGATGSADGTGSAAIFNNPSGLVVDGLSNVYVADTYNYTIRKITPAGVVTTIAGMAGTSGSTNGTGAAATFYFPQNLALDAVGNIYVTDEYNYRIRKITSAGVVTTLAGNANNTQIDGTGTAAGFADPQGLTIDVAGYLYVSDYQNLRKISIGGYSAGAVLPPGLTFDPSTGSITGTPLAASSAATYTVYGYNAGGSSTANINITVTGTLTAPAAVSAPAIAYAGPKSYSTGTAITALTPSNTGGAVPAATFGQVTTFAGSGAAGKNDGQSNMATFGSGGGVATDLYGNIYIADYSNNIIRKINAAGVVSILAGTGQTGSADGTGTAASFNSPRALTVDAAGNVYVADTNNDIIRKITPAGVVTTIAGSAGNIGTADGTGTAATFYQPYGIAVDASKNLYVTDPGYSIIRKITSAGAVTTFAGTAGTYGTTDGTGAAARFSNPQGIAVDAGGNIFVADNNNNNIRKITAAGAVTTFAGSGTNGTQDGTGTAASFTTPVNLTIDKAGNIYVADAGNHLIRKITKTGIVSTLAGNTLPGQVNDIGAAASFNSPRGMAVDNNGALYVSDDNNNVIRKVIATGYIIDNALPQGLSLNGATGSISGLPTSPLAVTTYNITAINGGGSSTATLSITVTGNAAAKPLVGAPVISYSTPKTYAVGTAIAAITPVNTGGAVPSNIYAQTSTLNQLSNNTKSIAIDNSGNKYVANGNSIQKITPSGAVINFAGSANVSGSANGQGTAATFNNPTGITFDASGNLYVADSGNQLIRMITPSGVVSTFAGNGATGSDNGTGTAATFSNPTGITIDAAGNLYVADQTNNLIRKITPAKVVSTLAGNTGGGFADGTGAAASFNGPGSLVADASGNIFVTDNNNNTIRKITSAGVVTTFAGTQGTTGTDNGTGTAAKFNTPDAITIDASGNFYVADLSNQLIRKISTAAVVTTLAGNGTVSSTDGVGSSASFYYPVALTVDATGNLMELGYDSRVRQISLSGFSLNGTLPAGLAFDATTGNIAGTPTLASAATNYSVTAYNQGGSSTATVNIAVTGTLTAPVNPVSAPVISYVTPQSLPAGTAASIPASNTGGAVPANSYSLISSFISNLNYTSNSLVMDGSGNGYFEGNNQVFKATPAGVKTVFAGNGIAGSADGTGSGASFNDIEALAIDAAGNIYVADAGNNLVRKITPAGVVTTLAGSITPGRVDGTGTNASFNKPQGLAVDAFSNVYVADATNNLIRKISPSGTVSTLAGSGSPGSNDGTGAAASFNLPYGVTIDAVGNLYVTDQSNYLVRKINPAGVVTTLAGIVGTSGYINGNAGTATFSQIYGIAIDALNNVYVADQGNLRIRKITASGVVSTLAGSGSSTASNGIGVTAGLYYPLALASDPSGNLLFTDYSGSIRKISLTGYAITGNLPAGLSFNSATGTISGTPLLATASTSYPVSAYNTGGSSIANVSIAVTGTATAPATPAVPVISYATPQVYAFGTTINPLLPSSTGGAVPAAIYGQTSTFAGNGSAGHDDGAAAMSSFNNIQGITTDVYGNIYVAENGNLDIRRISPTGVVSTIAGNGINQLVNGTGTSASFGSFSGMSIAVDKSNNIFVADPNNNVIRKITAAGVVTTFAGTGTYGFTNGSGSTASFRTPISVAVDAAGNVYVADQGNYAIRKITASGSTVTTLAGGTYGSANGTGSAASFSTIYSITTDPSGNIYVADPNNGLIRKVTSAGVVTTLAGHGSGYADGTGAAASFSNSSMALTTDAGGNVYVTDGGNNLIRKITPAGVVTTIAGNGNAAFANGTGAAAGFNVPYGAAVDANGNLFVVDQSNNVIRKVNIGGYTNNAPLSSGLVFDGTIGIISGTPTAVSPTTTYTINGYNSAGTGIANLSITVIYPPVLATTTPAGAFASMGDVIPVPVVVDAGINVSDQSKTTLASATVAITGNFTTGQDVLGFAANATTMGNIAGTYNTTTGVLSLTSSGGTATLANWQAALRAITYNNSNNVAPNVASRTITFTVNDGMFASNAATKTVTLTYTPSSNAKLTSLGLSTGTLSPVFSATTTAYSADVNNSVSSVTITPVTQSANATVKVNGTVVNSGTASAAIPLNVGVNNIATMVTAQDLTTVITYTVSITRNAAQTITFSAINPVSYGAADFSPGATSTNTTIPVIYTSSNTAVATIVSGNIHITGIGTATITASQAGNGSYDAAPSVTQTLTVNKAPLNITAVNQTKDYGAALPTLTLNYTGFVNGETAANLATAPTVSTTATSGSAAGTYPITASGAASANYTITYTAGTLTVVPVNLTVSATSQSKTYGASIPALTATYSGFVNGDSQSSLKHCRQFQPLLRHLQTPVPIPLLRQARRQLIIASATCREP